MHLNLVSFKNETTISMQNISFNAATLQAIPLEFIWLFASLLFLGAEIAAPGLFYCLAFAVGSVFAAGAAYLQYSITIQCSVLLVGTILTFIPLQRFIKKHHLSKKQFEKTDTNIDALIGQQALVIEPIKLHTRGLVKIRGELWAATTHEDKLFTKDSIVYVTRVKGNSLLIKSCKD